MAGFFEFALMRTRGDIDQKLLSELLHQYLHVEEDFMRELVGRGDTQLGRIFVHEPVPAAADAVQVLDYERATEATRTSTWPVRRPAATGGIRCPIAKSCDAGSNRSGLPTSASSSPTTIAVARSQPVPVPGSVPLLQSLYAWLLPFRDLPGVEDVRTSMLKRARQSAGLEHDALPCRKEALLVPPAEDRAQVS